MVMLSKELKEALLRGFPEDISNPISNGKMRFDEIKISNLNDAYGGVKIEFYWKNKPTHWERAEGVSLSNDMTLNICGITGEQGFTLL